LDPHFLRVGTSKFVVPNDQATDGQGGVLARAEREDHQPEPDHYRY
jgi:hypothetical protein